MRQEIVDLVTSHLATITKANGYLTDVGKQVKEWAYIDEVNPDSTLQVRDTDCNILNDNTLDNASEDIQTKRLTLQIVNITSEGVNQNGLAPKQLRLVIRDILKAIKLIRWPDGVIYVSLGSNSMGGQQESRKYIGVSQIIFVDYEVDAWTD